MLQHFCWQHDDYFPKVFGSKLILKMIKCSYDYCTIKPRIQFVASKEE